MSHLYDRISSEICIALQQRKSEYLKGRKLTMLTTLKAHLIGKSEVRHAQGGFTLTFLSQSAIGQQNIQTWIPTEEGDKFPFGPKLDANGIALPQGADFPDNAHPQKEYTLVITDANLEDDLALSAEIENLEEELETERGKTSILAEELEETGTQLTAAKENLNASMQENANLIAAKDAAADREAQLNEAVNKLNEELAALRVEKASEAESKVDPQAANAAAGTVGHQG